MPLRNTETKMSSFWRNFHHWLHWKLSLWQLPVQPVMIISSKWRHFRFCELHDSTQRKEIFPPTKTYCSFNKNFTGLLILMQCINKLYLYQYFTTRVRLPSNAKSVLGREKRRCWHLPTKWGIAVLAVVGDLISPWTSEVYLLNFEKWRNNT